MTSTEGGKGDMSSAAYAAEFGQFEFSVLRCRSCEVSLGKFNIRTFHHEITEGYEEVLYAALQHDLICKGNGKITRFRGFGAQQRKIVRSYNGVNHTYTCSDDKDHVLALFTLPYQDGIDTPLNIE